MATRASKFIYEIQAQYTGDQSIKKLQADLDALGKVQGHQQAVAKWKELNTQFREARQKVRDLRNALAQDPGNSGLARSLQAAVREQQSLRTAMHRQYETVRRAREGMEQYGMSARRAAEHLARLRQTTQAQGSVAAARNLLGTRADSDIRAQIANLQRAYQTLARSGTASLAELARAKQTMRARIRELTSQTNGWTAATGRLQAGFAKVVLGLGALRLGRAALSSLTEYDDAMRRVSAITGATEQEFAELDATAQKLAATTRFSAREVAAAMQQLAAAGQSVGQIQNSIQAAMDIAAIAQMDVGLAADQLTNIMSQFGIAAEHSSTVADTLAAGFTGASTTMDQLANAMLYCGPVAHALGFSLEDTTAVLMSLANAGYKGEKAGTALRGGFTRLIRPMRMGREVLEKYQIQVFDAQNNMRDFADVLEDIGRAGMTQAEIIKVFGQEAGPGMMALLGQGAAAIRKYREEIDAAGGRARKLADEGESGIGGARRRLEAAIDAMLRNFAAAAEPVLRPLIENLAELAAQIAGMSPGAKQAAMAVTTLLASLTALGGAVKAVQLAQFVFTLGGLSTSLNAVVASFGVASAAATTFRASVAAAGMATWAVFGVVLGWTILKLYEAVEAFKAWRAAREEELASLERGKQYKANLDKRLEAISEQTGITIRDFDDLRRKIDEGKLHYDDATRTWVAGARQRQEATEQQARAVVKAEGEALQEMIEAYKQYAAQIKSIQEDIAGRQKSLTAELREMGRSGMTDAQAWNDLKAEADEYVAAAKKAAEEAQAAMEAGDSAAATEKWKQAVALTDDAKQAYRQLNKEVKEGDQVAVSRAQALETAMRGVREAGELGISILRQQQEAAHAAMRELEKDSGMAGLVSGLDAAERKWLESWEAMSGAAKSAINDVRVAYQDDLGDQAEEFRAEWGESFDAFEAEGRAAAKQVERAIDDATRARTVTVHTNVVQGRRLGGLIAAPPPGYARGGKLPGYGGGDKVPAMLEPGEFVVRKEAVKRWGTGFFEHLNSLRLPDLSALLPVPQPAAAVPGRTVHINLTLPSGDTYQLSADPATAARIEREQERWWNLRSSNKVKRSGFARTRS